jgi:TPP-dependent pyruvate/acetoin dehydrogenase alpha subunit
MGRKLPAIQHLICGNIPMSTASPTASDFGSVSQDAWLDVYRAMCRARMTEERLTRLYHQGKIFGGVYTGFGHEAIGAATALAAGDDDLFGPCIRDMSVHLARGTTVLDVFRQYLGRVTGPTKGRDGNVHYGNPERGVYAMISHLGAMLSVVTGGVMARRRQGKDTIGMAYTGDGASSTGDFHEAVNFAAVFSVPVLFVIENNKFAYSTPNSQQYRCKQLIDRAPGYGIDGIAADGNNAATLHLLTRTLVEDIRERPRPVLLECDTLRIRGHGEHDDASYVPSDLKAEYTARDPLKSFDGTIVPDILTSEQLEAVDQECQAEVDAAYRQALGEPAPDPANLLVGVYAE